MKIAYVLWGDAHEAGDDVDPKDWSHGAVLTHTVGFVVKDDNAGISLCQEYWDSWSDKVRYATFIPKGMILLKKYLE